MDSDKRLISTGEYSLPKKEKVFSDGGVVGKKQGEVKTCLKCRRFFEYMGYGHLYCPQCKILDDNDFEKVRDFIYDNGQATAYVISEATGISVHQIEQYLREGRLEIPENSPMYIKCEMCGGDIRSGRVCPDCAMKLSNSMRIKMDLDEYQIGEPPKLSGKMRFLNGEGGETLKVNKRKPK